MTRGLIASGYAVEAVGDGREGYVRAKTREYDVMILDLTLPTMDGMSVLRELRSEGATLFVLVLTSRDRVEDRVGGLRAGADDYLVKPFAFDELLARLEALVRRRYAISENRIEVGPLTVDLAKQQAEVDGRRVDFTKREFAILEYLAARAGEVVSREDLDEHTYGDRLVLSNALDSAICLIRRKLKKAGTPPLIHTKRGVGFFLAAEDG